MSYFSGSTQLLLPQINLIVVSILLPHKNQKICRGYFHRSIHSQSQFFLSQIHIYSLFFRSCPKFQFFPSPISKDWIFPITHFLKWIQTMANQNQQKGSSTSLNNFNFDYQTELTKFLNDKKPNFIQFIFQPFSKFRNGQLT